MHRIFISYRRSDSESFSGRLRDRLHAEFGRRSVFMDTSTISGGAKFDEAIAQNLGSCKVVVAVIGKTWLSCTNEAGTRRLDDPADWVRQEMARALASDVLVIPVIFGGATMPASQSLPADLQPLAMRNAVAISDADFDSDVMKLIQACEPLVPRPRRWPLFAGVAAILVAIAAGVFYFISPASAFHGIRIVPGRAFYGSLPEGPAAGTGRQRYYLSLKVGAQSAMIDDLTRKMIYVGRNLSDLDAQSRQRDIRALRQEIRQRFTSDAAEDLDTVLARLLDDPIVAPALRVKPRDTVEAELGVFEIAANNSASRRPLAHCKFVIPASKTMVAPVFFLARKSDDCRPAS